MDKDFDHELIKRQIAMVRLTGVCNMFDAACVQAVADQMELFELVAAIGDPGDRRRDRKPYTNALLESGSVTREDMTPDELETIAEVRHLFLD